MRFMQKILPRKFFWQLMAIFLLFSIIPFVTLSWFSLDQTSRALEQETRSRITQMLRLVESNLNARFRSLSDITQKMYLYRTSNNGTVSDLEDILKNHKNAQFEMSNYVSNLLDSSDFLRNVLFIDRVNGRTYAAGRPAYKGLSLTWNSEDWDFLRTAAARPRALSISPSHPEFYFNFGGSSVFTFCRPYLSLIDLPEQETILGFLLLDIDGSIFSDAFDAYDWTGTGSLYVLDESRVARYAGDPAETGAVIPPQTSPEYIVFSETIPACGWSIEYRLNRRASMSGINHLRMQTALLTALTVLLIAILTLWSSRRVSRPIQDMLEQMKKVQAGDLNARVPVRRSDEIGELSDGFNHMVTALDTHIQHSYVASIKQKEAELDALRMQIHPHFLYNTLEVIRMSSVAHQDPETAQMTLSLVRQMQYVIGESSERVPLSRELAIVRDYISLVSLRYGQIDLSSAIPPALQACPILKMTLQPIVENAVQHGLRPIGGGQISISAQLDGNALIITVMDNGRGMDAAQLAQLRTQLRTDRLPEVKEDGLRSIGTKNVHDRIRLACGDEYGLEIESEEGVGTAVVIRLPYQPEEVSDEAADR